MLKYYIYLYTKMAKKSTVKLNFMEKITGAFVWPNPNLFWTKLMARFPPAPRLRRAGARQTERSGGHPIATPRLRSGCYGARKFLFTPLGKRSFSFGARPRFPPPPNFVPVKLARRLFLHLNYKFSRHYRFCKFICLTNIYPFWYTYRVVSKIK